METSDRSFPPSMFLLQTEFGMETVASVLSSIREGDFLVSVDLRDAYFQIPIHRSLMKWLWFLSCGVLYEFKNLCFGVPYHTIGVHQGVCPDLCLGSRSWDPSSPVSG